MSVLETVTGLVGRIEASSEDLERLAREVGAHGGLEAATAYAELWRDIHDSAETVNLGGLSEITEFISFNADRHADACRSDSASPEQIEALHGVMPMLRVFLDSPLDADALGNLIYYLQQSDWPVPMGENQAYTVMGRLLEQLQEAELSQEAEPSRGEGLLWRQELPQAEEMLQEEQLPRRELPQGKELREGEELPHGEAQTSAVEPAPAEAAPDEYRLSLPGDAHPQLVDAFFNEVPQLAEQFTELIQSFAEGKGDRDGLLHAQRLAHTIKGSSNVTGIPAIATLMHVCEDLLETLYETHSLPDDRLVQVLMESADCLASQLEFLYGTGPAPEQTEELVGTLRAWRIGDHAAVEAAPAARAEAAPEAEAAGRDGAATAAQPQESPAQSAPDSMRVPMPLIEQLLRQAGEVSISTVQLQGLSEALSVRMDTLMKQQTLMWERLNTIQELVEMRSVSTSKGLAVGQGGQEPVFDSLEMDEYNELHTATNFLAESITDTREYTTQVRDEFSRLKAMLKQQDVLSRELNESVMGTRMVPFRSIVPRLTRVVRQTARSTGKSVHLDIQGEEVMVDSAVLNRLTDSLMHMLRNAVDHGIEDTAERARRGKPDTGQVSIRVERYGDNVSLLIQDDGKGLNYDRIRQIGAERGLIQGDPSNMSEQELARLVLLPGISTREETTQISGRGIGMDVVNTAVMEQRGTLDIRSEPGRGIEVTIRVPMTLISVHTLLVRNSGIVLGVPSSSVQQLIFSDLGQFRHEGDGPVFEFEERDFRVVSLSRLVGIEADMPALDGARPVPLLLIQGEREACAVVLEEVLDSRYLVVKRLGRYVPQVPGVIGGAILGDGSVAGVVDVRELLRQQSEGLPGMLQNAVGAASLERRTDLPVVLVVDDSVSARRSLSELVTDAGYRSMTAIDGLAALSSIEQEKPAAVLLDMEMPRMNGLELATHLRADSETSGIPLIMITSRSTEKHRRQAEMAGVNSYFTKPYREDSLVDELQRLIQ